MHYRSTSTSKRMQKFLWLSVETATNSEITYYQHRLWTSILWNEQYNNTSRTQQQINATIINHPSTNVHLFGFVPFGNPEKLCQETVQQSSQNKSIFIFNPNLQLTINLITLTQNQLFADCWFCFGDLGSFCCQL